MLHESSCKRRKLAIHVVSKVTNPEPPKEIPDEVNEIDTFDLVYEISASGPANRVRKLCSQDSRIDDVTIFKNSSSLLPLPQPYIKITPVGTKSKL